MKLPTRWRIPVLFLFPLAAVLFALAAPGCSDSGASDPVMSDEEIIAMLKVADEMQARVEALLATNPSPTSDDLLQAIQDIPGVAFSGAGEGAIASAWTAMGERGPVQWVTVEPKTYLDPPPPPGPLGAPPPPAPGPGNGKRYGFFKIPYPTAGVPDLIMSLLNMQGYTLSATGAGTLQDLRGIRTLKVLYLTTHSFTPKRSDNDLGPEEFSLMTAESVPPHPYYALDEEKWPVEIRRDLAANRLGVSVSCDPVGTKCIEYWFINHNFVQVYFSFDSDSLFFIDACSSGAPKAEKFRQALFANGLSTAVGWTAEVTWDDGWERANLFFDRWLGLNVVEPKPDPPQRPFDAESVRASLAKDGQDSTTHPELGIIAKLIVLAPDQAEFAGAPSIELIQIKEKDKEMKIGGIFGTDPGADRRKVKMAGQVLEVKEWKEDEITCTLPESSSGSQVDVQVEADDHEGNKVQITEWTVKFTHEGHSEMKDTDTGEVFASTDGTYTFDVKFRADVHEYREEAGQEPMNKVIVPYEIEDDGTMSWSGTARFQDQTEPFSGTTTNLYDIDYTDPGWPGNLPADTDLLAGEGYIDMNTKKLYLFLVGIGDDSGSGTFNLGTQTDCQYEHDQYTNRVYLIFDLDENYEIQNSSCTDQVTDDQGQYTYNGTRSWEFTTRSPPDPQAAR